MAKVPFNSERLIQVLEEQNMNILDLAVKIPNIDSIKFLETEFINGIDYVDLFTLLRVAHVLGVPIYH